VLIHPVDRKSTFPNLYSKICIDQMCGWLINELIHLLLERVSLRSSGHNYLADQEKFCLSWNLTFSLTYSQEPTLGPVLSHLISVNILISFFFNKHFIILQSCFCYWIITFLLYICGLLYPSQVGFILVKSGHSLVCLYFYTELEYKLEWCF
jgi:hypothetical protein